MSDGAYEEFEPGRRPGRKKRGKPAANKTATNGNRNGNRKPEPPRWQPAYYGGFQPEPEPEPAPDPTPHPAEALAAPSADALIIDAPTVATTGTPNGTTPADQPSKTSRRPLSTHVRAAIAGLVLLLAIVGTLVFALRPGRQVVNPVPASDSPAPHTVPGNGPPAAAAPPPGAVTPPPVAPPPPGSIPTPGGPPLLPNAKAPAPAARPAPAPASATHHTGTTPKQPNTKTAPAHHAPAEPEARTRSPQTTSASDPDQHHDDEDDTPRPPRRDDDPPPGFPDILGSLQTVLPGLG